MAVASSKWSNRCWTKSHLFVLWFYPLKWVGQLSMKDMNEHLGWSARIPLFNARLCVSYNFLMCPILFSRSCTPVASNMYVCVCVSVICVRIFFCICLIDIVDATCVHLSCMNIEHEHTEQRTVSSGVELCNLMSFNGEQFYVSLKLFNCHVSRNTIFYFCVVGALCSTDAVCSHSVAPLHFTTEADIYLIWVVVAGGTTTVANPYVIKPR